MTLALNKHRVLLSLAGLAAIGLIVGVLARVTLVEMVIGSLLRMAGASEIRFNVAQASPWNVVLEDVDLLVKAQAFGAKRVSVARNHWWTPSLGVVRVEQARVPFKIDGSGENPRLWTTYKNGTAAQDPSVVPAEEVYVDGQVVIQASDLPEQSLTVKIAARLVAKNTWTAELSVDGPGLGVKGEGRYDLATEALDFKVSQLAVDLKPWQNFLQRLVPLPGGRWEMEGKISGDAEGRWVDSALVAGGSIKMRDGRVYYPEKDITAEGIDADLEFTDFDKVISKPGTVRVREVRTGKLVLSDLSTEIAFTSSDQMAISQLALTALGGRVTTEPFKYFFNLQEIETVVLVDGISIEQVMALTQDLPAKATGRVNGRFPLRIDGSGVRLGTGWLELKPGVPAEVQLQAAGLLTGGVAPSNPSYGVLKKVESGLLKLKISELRLDIRPPNAPPGRSAQLRISGEPVDPGVKAPVTLDLNVNGPLEKLINLGMDSRLRFGN